MTDEAKSHQIKIDVSEGTMEQIKFLAEQQGISILALAGKLLAEEAGRSRAGTRSISSKVHVSVRVAVSA